MIDFRKKVIDIQDSGNGDNMITSANGYVKTTQCKWVPISTILIFYIEGRKVKADTIDKTFTLTDEFISDERAGECLENWIKGNPYAWGGND
jgi:hypothetical protein